MRAPNEIFYPGSELEQEEVRKQLHEILASPAFQNSRRYAAVLKYLVDQTLEGNGAKLKERTIGIEVFDRAPDYDTSSDHAVRSAVAEIRKRLAQYYQQDAHTGLRIEVLPGSYVPQFRRANDQQVLASGPTPFEVKAESEHLPRVPVAQDYPYRSRIGQKSIWIAVGCLILAAATGLFYYLRAHDALESFWEPVLSSHSPVLLCVGNVEGGRLNPSLSLVTNPNLSLSDFHSSPSETILVDDAFTATKFAGLMQARGKSFRLASQSDTTFTDLQQGPAVLVGLLNNDWTQRLMPNLRFKPIRAGPTRVVLSDRANPSKQDWSVDYGTPYLNLTRDYALVLRMVDPKTEQVVVVAAGLTVFGTHAAGDFLTNRNEIQKLAAIAPPGWQRKNMEIVLSTDVIRGRSGPATIVATQFW